MYVVCVHIWVKPGQSEAFIEATKRNHEGTLQEEGALRFDVLRQAGGAAEGEAERFLLYEVYRTEADFKTHQQSAHYLAWREAVGDLMAEPRQGLRFDAVYPDPWR